VASQLRLHRPAQHSSGRGGESHRRRRAGGNFDPDYYRSDRKDQKIEELTIVVSGNADDTALEKAAHEAQIIGESQNFTRDQ